MAAERNVLRTETLPLRCGRPGQKRLVASHARGLAGCQDHRAEIRKASLDLRSTPT